jgi:hypothetical protein
MMRELSEFYRNFQKNITEYIFSYIIICSAGVECSRLLQNASCGIFGREKGVKNAGYGNFGD